MPKITVDVTNEQAQVFERAIASGEYTETAQIFQVALARWETERFLESPEAPTTEELRALWHEGKASGTAGPIDWDKLLEQVQAEAAKSRTRVA